MDDFWISELCYEGISKPEQPHRRPPSRHNVAKDTLGRGQKGTSPCLTFLANFN